MACWSAAIECHLVGEMALVADVFSHVITEDIHARGISTQSRRSLASMPASCSVDGFLS